MSLHTYAWCRSCRWHVENPSNAAQEEHRKQPGHVVVSRSHPKSLCTPECSEKRKS